MAIAYLLLAIRQSIWCWFCAAVSSGIYIYLFIGARLYMESGLNLYYFLMAAYGWIVWNDVARDGDVRPVVSWPLHWHLAAIAAIVAVSALSGTLLNQFTDAALPFIDSLTTWGALWATFLVARKVFENWWYWLAIDAVSVWIYWTRDLELTSVLFFIYVLMIPFGMLAWRRSMQADVG